MKKKTLLLFFILLLSSSYSYAYDCRNFLGTWDITCTRGDGETCSPVVWIFTDATQDVAMGIYSSQIWSTQGPIQVVWSDSKGQYRLFYPDAPSNGDTYISLLGDTLVGTEDESILGHITLKGTRRPGTGPTTTTTTIITTTTTTILPTTTTTTTILPTTTTTISDNKCAASYLLEDDEESLNLLRQFRDERLMNTEQGKTLVKLYYQYSSAVCIALENNPELKERSKIILQTLIPVIRKDLQKGEDNTE